MMDEFVNLEDWFAPEPDCIHSWVIASKTYDRGGNMTCDYYCESCGEEKAVVFYNTTNISITGGERLE